jgi:hypothetical protein
MNKAQIHKQKPERELKVEDRRVVRNNHEIRPFMSIAEAAAIALSRVLSRKKLPEDGDA